MMKEDSFVLWERRSFWHLACCGHRGNNLKITFLTCYSETLPRQGKSSLSETLPGQSNTQSNIQARGTSVGLMTGRGTHCPRHNQRPLTLLQDQETLDNSPALRPRVWHWKRNKVLVKASNFRGHLWSISGTILDISQSHHASGFINVLG